MPGRKFDHSSLIFRYGFNGKENDDEVKGEGNQQDYGMRIYDPRLGRFLSVDPLYKEFTNNSSYLFAGDNPLLFIDFDGAGPRPAYDPTLGKRLVTSFADVLIRCQNASLASFEAYGWSRYYFKNKSDARDNKYLGLAGEAIVADYLRLNAAPYARRLKSMGDRVGSPFLSSTDQLYTHFNSLVTIGGWDDDKSVDLLYSLNLGNKGTFQLGINMRFNDVNGKPINEREGGERFDNPVNFVIEVKTGSTIQNFTKGFSQALKKAKGVPNGVAVVAMDHDAYLNALENKNFKSQAADYLKAGGRIMLIGDLNENAMKLREKSVKEVQKGSNPYTVPSR